MMVNGQKKGRKNENEVCRLFSALLDPINASLYPKCPIDALPVRRLSTLNPVVGHWRGSGDFVFAWSLVHADFPFTCEAKKVEGWSLDGLATGQCGKLVNFWQQTVEQAKEVAETHRTDQVIVGGRPLLVVTRNRMPFFMIVRVADFDAYFELRSTSHFKVEFMLGDERLILCQLRHVLLKAPSVAETKLLKRLKRDRRTHMRSIRIEPK